MSNNINELIDGNLKWVSQMNKIRPGFFEELAKAQYPEYLWIGCSDSRVPATEITNTLPGSIFVHRNIANMVVHTDNNMLSVVYYAVNYLKVKHIIVCGHYGCGGVKAAIQPESFGYLDSWLNHIKEVYLSHSYELNAIDDLEERAKKLVEYNVMKQVHNIATLSFVQSAWAKGEFPYIHGFVYDLADGIINDLNVSINSCKGVEPIFRYIKP